ncbi:MAG TPA: hydroxyisourate hydrolase [Myxococcales bacterium]|jgi:5-hydroxyisourate hydrolase|nr:hydroxyisourate hydrolase [Myxococcales bacterium]
MITTHVLDTAQGKPAAGVGVTLFVKEAGAWRELGRGQTDADGRLRTLAPGPVAAGTYRLLFDTAARSAFFPEVSVVFAIEAGASYHVPLLISPFGYSTYRGS